uniref:Endonuclease/exonuclease/phosphatase domain-containing protein n=1 Tax=Mucochytrium quahogii TaxID=96639 RepID=A0A7S2S908_9STRA|mmetsp:Transcript_9963/g.18881  ORF Transcript_9963/g.18881 Transcript_9963/m.18881 type:complete len:683 (-) Transcript_9963:1808-3856(-)
MPPTGKAERGLDVVTNDLENKEKEERLIVRIDQPIENVEFAAHTLLRGIDGGVLTPSSRKIKYKWFRSHERRNCSYGECPSKRKAATFQSLLNGKRYCSGRCFEQDWDRRTKKIVDKSYFEGASSPWSIKPFEEDTRWRQISDDKLYIPTGEDVGHVLKVECSAVANDGRVSVSAQSKETSVVIGLTSHNTRLFNREFINSKVVERKGSVSNFLQAEGGGAVLRVMTYNVLAEVYATRQLYPYCPLWALGWGYRKQLVLKELEHHNADIICLQEIQADAFDSYIFPELAVKGYDGVFKSKTRESMGRKGKIDGCAIIYKKDKLRMIESKGVEFNDIALKFARSGGFHRQNCSARENQVRTDRVLKRLCRDNVSQVCLFETIPAGFQSNDVYYAAAKRAGPQKVCVATTHIFWDPEYSDVKFWQTQALLQELGPMIGSMTPVMICGDFNSTPDSQVVEYLGNSSVDPDHPDFEVDPLRILPPANMMSHGLGLDSAYKSVLGSEPKCTNYTAHYAGVLDYIWFSKNSLTPLNVLSIPDEETLRGEDNTHMPNSCFPSDHISLCFDVNINPSQRVTSRPSTPTPPSPPMSPPLLMSSRTYDHLQQFQQMHMHSPVRNSGAPKGMQHSPNPAMLNQQGRNPYAHMQQQGAGMGEGVHSPALHPLSQQQMMLQQQQQQHHHYNNQYY